LEVPHLIVYGLFKNNDRMIVNNKVGRMWKEESWLNWEIYPNVLLGQPEVNQEKPHNGLSQSRPRFKPGSA